MMVSTSLIGVGLYTYVSIFGTVEKMLGQKLDHIARTAALLIDPDDHKKIEEAYLAEEQNIENKDYFKRVQKVLQDIKNANQLKENIYTVIAPEWADGNMLFMAMSAEKTYIGNAIHAHELVKKTIKTGEPQFSRMYEDSEGKWVSGFSPIKDAAGNTIAVFEVDYHADGDVWQAKLALIKSIGIPAVFAMILALICGGLIGLQMTQPLSLLAEGARKVATGDLTVKIEKRSGDEIGLLTDTFNSMVGDLLESKQKLEDYAKNLELKVEERTKSLMEAKKEIETLLNNLGQGFFTFDSSGRIGGGSTKAAEDFFGVNPTGKPITELLRLDDKESAATNEWLDVCFSNMVDFKSAAALGPGSFDILNNKFISLDYRPINDEKGNLEKIICIAEDKTKEKKLERKALEEAEFAGFVTSLVKDRDGFMDFISSTKTRLSDIIKSISKYQTSNDINIEELFRQFHTVKGESACYHLLAVREKAHELESYLANLGANKDSLAFNDIKEKLLSETQALSSIIQQFLAAHQDIIGDNVDSGSRIRNIQDEILHKVAFELRKEVGTASDCYKHFVNEVLLEDVSQPFLRYKNVIQTVARQQEKVVEYEVENHGIKLALAPYMPLIGSCVHLFRNAVDHGIETPDEREQIGKPRAAHIRFEVLESPTKPGSVRFVLTDDGKGIDPKIIASKVLEKGFKTEAQLAALSEHEIQQLVFLPGFSSKNEVTDISGRGVGLDAVKAEAETLGGNAWLESVLGKGTTFVIEVPKVEILSHEPLNKMSA